MKRIVPNLLICLFAAITACDREKDKLSVSPAEIVFTADDTNAKTVTVDTNVKQWDATPSSSWITVNKGEGMFAVTVEKNTSTSADRTGTITVKAGSAKQEIVTVNQSAAVVNTLSLTKSTLTFEADNTDRQEVVVLTDVVNWNYSGVPLWLTLEKDGLTLHVTPAGLNFETNPREAMIIITAGNATPVSLQVIQEVTRIEYSPFDTAEGLYFGNMGAGTALFALDMYNASDEMAGIQILGFSTYASAEKFRLDAGTYHLTEIGEAKSFIDGEYDSGEDMFFGSFVYDVNLEKFTLITGGTFDVELTGNTYTITTNFTGKDAFTNAAADKIRYSYTGTIQFEDLSDDMSETGIAESDYTATGTPQLQFTGGYESKSEWDGKVEPVFDDDNFGPYIAITNFADEDITIYADYIAGKFLLDAQYPLWEDGKIRAYLEYFVIYKDEVIQVSLKNPWTVEYDKMNQTLDFSGLIDINLGGTVGVVNDLPLHTGVYVYDFNYTENDEEFCLGFLTNIYPDIKLELTPVSPAPAKASKFAGKTVLNKPAIPRSKLASLTRSADKKAVMADRSQLFPVNNKKFDRIKLNNGKPVDRKSYQKTMKK